MDSHPPFRSRGRWWRGVTVTGIVVVGLLAVAVAVASGGRDDERDRARAEAGRAAERYAAALGTALVAGSVEIHAIAFPQLSDFGFRATADTVELTFESAQVVSGVTVQARRVSRCFVIRSPVRPESADLPLADLDCADLLPVSPTPTTWVVPAR